MTAQGTRSNRSRVAAMQRTLAALGCAPASEDRIRVVMRARAMEQLRRACNGALITSNAKRARSAVAIAAFIPHLFKPTKGTR